MSGRCQLATGQRTVKIDSLALPPILAVACVNDQSETRDLSRADPDRAASLAAAWERYARDVGIVLPDAVPYRP